MKEPDEAPKKGRKKKTEGAKEHKKNWRETYATVEEIKAFLADHIFLRHNVITGRVECRIPSSYTSEGTRDWEPISDRVVNSLWVELSSLYFRQPTEVESGEFISVARAMQIVSANISQKLSSVHLGRALCDLGFRRVKYQGVRGYIVVCRKADEMQMVQRSMAREASPDGWTEDSNGQ